MKSFRVAALCFLLAASLLAQTPKTGTSQPDVKAKPAEKSPAGTKTAELKAAAAGTAAMPKPAPEMERVAAQLSGRWDTIETHEPSPMMPQGGTGKGVETIRPGPGGLSLLMEYKSESPAGIFSGFGLLTYDPAARVYHLHWTDNTTPGVVVLTGKWDDKNLVFTREDTVSGKKMFARHTISDLAPEAFTYTIEVGPALTQLKRELTIKYAKVNLEDMRGRQIRGRQ